MFSGKSEQRLFCRRLPRLAVLLPALVFFCLVPPEILARGPALCLWQHLLHLTACPACGSTRALAALFHGRFRDALAFNHNVVVTAPILLGLLTADLFKVVRVLTLRGREGLCLRRGKGPHPGRVSEGVSKNGVMGLRRFLSSARVELPAEPLARWASVFFSLSVLSLLISLAAAQAFFSLSGLVYAIHLLRHRSRISFPPVKLPLVLFCLATVTSVFFAANPAAGWLAVRKLVLFLIVLLAVNLVISPRHLKWLYQVLFVEAAVVGIVATWQFVVQYRAVRALHPQEMYRFMTSERIHGFQGHWMNFGGQQMLIFGALLAMLLLSPLSASDSRLPQEATLRRAPLWWLVLAIVVLSIILNFTRSVWLGCLIATVYLVGRWRPRWLWVLPVLAIAGYFGAPGLVHRRIAMAVHPTREPALSLRLEMWGVGWRMIKRHPWVGVGPNNITEVYTLYLAPGETPQAGYREHLHDNFIQLAAERGLPCLAAWVWFMMALGWHCWKIARQRPSPRWISDGVVAGWLAFVAEGFFEFNFGTSPVLMLFLFVVSTPFIVDRLARAGDRQYH
jgi:putative inorganic carbon (hco3(-)) transporter